MSHIFATSQTSPHRRSRRVLIMAAAVVGVAVTAAATYAGYALTRSATQLKSLGCYETVSLSADTSVISPGGGSPVAACAGAWSSAFPGVEQPSGFAACVLDSGAIGVFPASGGSDPCEKLGLPRLAEAKP